MLINGLFTDNHKLGLNNQYHSSKGINDTSKKQHSKERAQNSFNLEYQNRWEFTLNLIHLILTVVDLQNLKIHYPWIYLCDKIELKLTLTLSVTF